MMVDTYYTSRIYDSIREQYNEIIRDINSTIRTNNSNIDSSSNEYVYKKAVQSNKEVTRASNYLKRGYKNWVKHLKKLINTKFRFNEKTKYKQYSFNIESGRIKLIKSEYENDYRLHIVGRKIWVAYADTYGSDEKKKLIVKTDDITLKKL